MGTGHWPPPHTGAHPVTVRHLFGWVWASEHMLLLQQPSMVLQAAATAHH